MPIVIEVAAEGAVVIMAGGIKKHIPSGARVTIEEDGDIKISNSVGSPPPAAPEASEPEDVEEEFYKASDLHRLVQSPVSKTLTCDKCRQEKRFEDLEKIFSAASTSGKRKREEHQAKSEEQLLFEYQSYIQDMPTVRVLFKQRLRAAGELDALSPSDIKSDVEEIEKALFQYWLRWNALYMPGGKVNFEAALHHVVDNHALGLPPNFNL